MKIRTTLLNAIALAAIMSLGDAAWAQRGGEGGDRGGSRGGDRGGGDRGSDRGGSRGGPMMGGPMMGGPMMGGPSFGGGGFPPGGSFGGGFGGPPGGSFGGGFGGGSFSPIDMLRRFDRNGNNTLDPDEMEGPARFFVDRMAQNNPRIDVNRPIPLDRLAEEMDRMRQERMGGSMPGMPGMPGTTTTEPQEPEPLVPGFDKVEEKPAVAGFGVPDENASVKVEDRDLREAEDRLRRYDTNKDGVLSKEEMANSRWSDDPMQYDRNRDGKLTKNELAVRYAKRRLAEQAEQSGAQPGSSSDPRSRFAGMSSSWGSRGGESSSWGSRGADNGGGWGSRDGGTREGGATDEKKEQPASYRAGSTRDKSNQTKGLPDWFARSDANNDGQVMMAEYSPNWNADKVAEFAKFDLNSDGIVTSRECLSALKNSGKTTTTIASTTTSSTSSSGSGEIVSKIGDSKEAARKAWAERQVAKYDKNKDGQLTVDEWSSMAMKPKEGTDANKDGVITTEEYAAQAR